MKRPSFIVSVIALLVLCSNHAAVHAEEPDFLLGRLVERGILTADEADALRREQQQTEWQRQEQLNQQVKGNVFELPKPLKGLTVGMLGYLDFSAGDLPEFNDQDESFNAFRVTRGYLTVKKEITSQLHARVTLDAHQDGTGDYKARLKYYYAEWRPHDFAFLTDMKSEIGMGHMPWLDFEEHVNPYRCQGTMAVERAGVFNSSDLGVSLRGNFFGKVFDAKDRLGNDHYDGRWGTWHVGLYNGSGYHAVEENCNKAIEGRFTVRPLPDFLPGLQLSYLGIHGDGNMDYPSGWPDYDVNMTMLSYQQPWLVLTAQYFATKGNAKGTWVDAAGNALDTAGYSFFTNLRIPIGARKLWWFARYDHFDQDVDARIASNAYYDMWITGLAYYLTGENLIMVVYEGTDYGAGANKKGHAPNPAETRLGNDQKVQVVMQVKF
ncbi:MAG: hypothetical protein JW888_10965 [Pirellulales bacterium]|nr:hypothetical protein [Pirellulales bacterium]